MIPTVPISDLFGPGAGGDGADLVGSLAPAVAGVATGGDDGLVAGEDAGGAVVVAEELPDRLDRVALGAGGWPRQQRAMVGAAAGLGTVPARRSARLTSRRGIKRGPLVADDDRVLGAGAVPTACGPMPAHGRGVDRGQDQRGAGTAARADGTEPVGRPMALALGPARPAAAACPLPGQLAVRAAAVERAACNRPYMRVRSSSGRRHRPPVSGGAGLSGRGLGPGPFYRAAAAASPYMRSGPLPAPHQNAPCTRRGRGRTRPTRNAAA
jgi:hypothetical protein